jgi:transcriptional regulator with PAS, ATPase and Fis domain
MSNQHINQSSKEDKLQKALASTGITELMKEIGAVDELPSPRTDKALAAFITVDPDTLKIKAKVRRLAFHDVPVLLMGETGVGKELLAKALHGERKGEFVAVNTAGIPDTLLESEMFGTEYGAFTGSKSKGGLLEEAADGTIFLDEIGDMPMVLQCKLLRTIQERKARRLGSAKDYDVRCRFVAATNKTLAEMSTGEKFRLDLFHRFNTKLFIKPLRERLCDAEQICKEKLFDYTSIKEGLNFPGNVRELLNYIEEANIFKGLE